MNHFPDVLPRTHRGAVFGWLVFAGTVLSLTSGCGPSHPKLGQVTGKLIMDGEPIANGSIEFIPEGGGRPSLALTDEEGKFTAFYLPNVPGVERGKHRIRFEVARGKPGDPGLVRPKGRGRVQGEIVLTPSTIEVQEGENEVTFEITEQT